MSRVFPSSTWGSAIRDCAKKDDSVLDVVQHLLSPNNHFVLKVEVYSGIKLKSEPPTAQMLWSNKVTELWSNPIK